MERQSRRHSEPHRFLRKTGNLFLTFVLFAASLWGGTTAFGQDKASHPFKPTLFGNTIPFARSTTNTDRPRFFIVGPYLTDKPFLQNAARNQLHSIAPWTGLGRNVPHIFSGSNALLHLSAVAGTFLIIETGLDTRVHNFFARNTFFDEYSHPGVRWGAIFPVLLSGGLWGSGLIGGSSRLGSAGGAVLQASLLAVCYSSALKALTGRPGPDPEVYDNNRASETFRFGFLRGGVYHGWPSGHMLANTAALTSLVSFYKNSTWLKIAGGAYLSYLFLSVISHGHSSMHWFSDAVAGTLMGYAVGSTVGSDFRKSWEKKNGKAGGPSVGVLPQLFTVSFRFSI